MNLQLASVALEERAESRLIRPVTSTEPLGGSTRTLSGFASRDAALRRSSASRLARANALQANHRPKARWGTRGPLSVQQRAWRRPARRAKVDTVEGGGVDPDLEVDVEPEAETAETSEGSSTVQWRFMRIAKVELDDGAIGEAARDRRVEPSRRSGGRGRAPRGGDR